ncbi:aminoglycoside phosphotransferase (APT) family kinase protein [Paenibacillus rhizosphaerae]|uniref:Aminoglycoside phosphotransferase (APT) family kinase protein n=1 Tax=Paenibacillus rhizosphaerae TaxID=297318 RepID=A0A839TPW5_9BACL|nr:aminoglycoside phosphotransferase family protein [Paenibacillus rhizosphaerae]MBB3128601.1 aminoglycoside phosphotransferase (APT) family kinase protein [Paenibacillus rhizosphaerae]
MSFSVDKINTDLVRRLIRKQFPKWADLPVRPVEKGGYDNFTFHLGDEMSVRLPRDEGHAPQVEKEAEWLPKLRPHLSLPITVPLAKGIPDEGYPFYWSVNRWITGETLRQDNISDINEFAVDLSRFIKELHQIDASNGPAGGEHNYFRGCPLTVWKFNEWTLGALETLGGAVDAEKCLKIWHQATASKWTKKPVWIHGDINPGNLLVKDGKLSSVIDFGVMAVGDPAVEITMAWTFFDDKSRKVFLQSIGLDAETENRARGWALWKALITWASEEDKESISVREAKKVIDILQNE